MLFIKNLREDDSGNYICQGIYANNEQISATVKVSTFSKSHAMLLQLVILLNSDKLLWLRMGSIDLSTE